MVRPTSPTAQLARYGFADAARAAALLGSPVLAACDGHPQVLGALGGSADPDLALRQLHRLTEAANRAGARDPVAAICQDAILRDRLCTVLGASAALGDHLVAEPTEWTVLSTVEIESFDAVDVPGLRRAYRRNLLRIAAADLTGAHDVVRTMADLSELADAVLRNAFELAVRQVGAHRRPALAVVAMGKCGGRELNYVSDVDVIFVAADDEDLSTATAVAARLMQICGAAAWPIDAALRPEGSSGPLVRTLASHLAYYRKWARTWEFQALLKARPVAGAMELAGKWLAALQPLVWQAVERPEAVDDIRAMRRRIIDSVPRHEVDREIKRGPGGLRDIEFAVQLLQLVHGRGDETLRSSSTLDALCALVDGGYVGRADGEALAASYRFLRTVEHRLQLQRLQRTHTVPDSPAALRWLAHALGYRADARSDAVQRFRTDWLSHAGQVRRLHAKLLYRPLLESVAKVPAQALRMRPEAARDRLHTLGFADPAGALRHIQALTDGVSRTAAIQRTLLPVLLEEFADTPEPDRGLLAYRKVSEKLGATPWYLRLLRDEGPVALRLARLLGLSAYVTELLSREPEALRILADDAELVARPVESLMDGFRAAAEQHLATDGDRGAAIAAVRALRRRELLRVACADLLYNGGGLAPSTPMDVVGVGRAISDITDATLAAALRVAEDGSPVRFCVIAMGRLGGHESGYASDADVLFVYDPPVGMAEEAAASAAHTIASELRGLLAAPAPDPPLAVDADLRPEGRQGPLVRSLAAYAQYYARWSRVWEAQALLRARFVAGDAELGQRFIELVDQVRYPAGGLRREQVVEIRRIKARVDSERLPRGADPLTHTKLGRGGLADIEWAVQLLQLRHGHEVAGLRTTNTLQALAAAAQAGLVTAPEATVLATAWRLATRVRNALTLVRGRPSDQLPRHGPQLAGVAAALGADDPGAFVDSYLRATRHSRRVVERILAA